ncbi:hypothetical protein Tco_0590018 [Tanacetum coccineum]
MTTLAEFMIIAGNDNRPPMLEKSLYDSWKNRMELYIKNQENRRMILNTLQNGLLVWPTAVEKDGTTRTKKYEEFSVAEKLQADCDLKSTNIVLQGLPPDVYAIVNHHKVAKEIWDRVKLLMQGLVVPVFNQGDDPIACLNKEIAFLTVVASSRFPSTNNQLRTSSNLRNQATIQDDRVIVQQVQGRQGQSYPKRPRNVAWFKENAMLAEAQESGQILDEEQLAFLADPGIPDGQDAQTTIPNTVAFQTKDLDAYDSDCDDVSNVKVVLMANLFNYDSDVISEKIKELDNIVYKVGQSDQIVHKLTKPQVFYDDTHKQALGYQNPFYLKKAQRIKPTLYDGSVISSQHVASHVINDEETLILEELEEHIKILRENVKEEKVKHEMDEIETINIKLKHSVTKLLYENERLHKEIEHLKKIYKDQFDWNKKTRALSKEHCDSLITQLNSKSKENKDLKGQIQEKVFVTTSLQSELSRLKGKHVLDNAIRITNATTIAPGMFKLDIDPLSHRLKNNRDAHEDYLKKTIENTDTIRGLVECARK